MAVYKSSLGSTLEINTGTTALPVYEDLRVKTIETTKNETVAQWFELFQAGQISVVVNEAITIPFEFSYDSDSLGQKFIAEDVMNDFSKGNMVEFKFYNATVDKNYTFNATISDLTSMLDPENVTIYTGTLNINGVMTEVVTPFAKSSK